MLIFMDNYRFGIFPKGLRQKLLDFVQNWYTTILDHVEIFENISEILRFFWNPK